MTDRAPPSPLGDDVEPARTLLTTMSEYRGAVDRLLAGPATEVLVFDPDGEQLRLDTAERNAQLDAILAGSPESRIRIVVHQVDHLATRCHRFVNLLKTWSGRIEVNVSEGEARRAQDCFVVVDHDDCVRRGVAAQARGVLIRADPHEVALQRLRFEEIWASSTTGLSPTTLGL